MIARRTSGGMLATRPAAATRHGVCSTPASAPAPPPPAPLTRAAMRCSPAAAPGPRRGRRHTRVTSSVQRFSAAADASSPRPPVRARQGERVVAHRQQQQADGHPREGIRGERDPAPGFVRPQCGLDLGLHVGHDHGRVLVVETGEQFALGPLATPPAGRSWAARSAGPRASAARSGRTTRPVSAAMPDSREPVGSSSVPGRRRCAGRRPGSSHQRPSRTSTASCVATPFSAKPSTNACTRGRRGRSDTVGAHVGIGAVRHDRPRIGGDALDLVVGPSVTTKNMARCGCGWMRSTCREHLGDDVRGRGGPRGGRPAP